LGRGLGFLILQRIIAKTAKLGSEKAGVKSIIWENCMKISIGNRPFISLSSHFKSGEKNH
jgi:hypothetical protein